MLVTIGIQNVAREVRIETDETEEALSAAITKAVTSGEPLVIASTKGHKTFVPAAAIAFVEIGQNDKRSVGFAQPFVYKPNLGCQPNTIHTACMVGGELSE
jgi:hypothetical protein